MSSALMQTSSKHRGLLSNLFGGCSSPACANEPSEKAIKVDLQISLSMSPRESNASEAASQPADFVSSGSLLQRSSPRRHARSSFAEASRLGLSADGNWFAPLMDQDVKARAFDFGRFSSRPFLTKATEESDLHLKDGRQLAAPNADADCKKLVDACVQLSTIDMRLEGDWVYVGQKSWKVTQEHSRIFIKALIEADGERITGPMISKRYLNGKDFNPSKAMKPLPPELKALIEVKRGPGGGFRLKK